MQVNVSVSFFIYTFKYKIILDSISLNHHYQTNSFQSDKTKPEKMNPHSLNSKSPGAKELYVSIAGISHSKTQLCGNKMSLKAHVQSIFANLASK